jgi:hypothetical protein
MAQRKRIEVFSAGCSTCNEAVEMVKRVAGSDHDVDVLDMHRSDVAARAKGLGVRSIPSVLVDGRLADCPSGGVDETTLRSELELMGRRHS